MGEPENNNVIERILPPKNLSSSSSSSLSDENEELQRLVHAPPFWRNPTKKKLSKQLSMCEVPRDMAWERRRRQYLRQERRRNGIHQEAEHLTDEDLNELKGCIELGFGFNESEGQRLCTTIPALDLYFAVNRQLAISPGSSPNSCQSAPSPIRASTSTSGLGTQSSSCGSPRSESDAWKICNPGKSLVLSYVPRSRFMHNVSTAVFSIVLCSIVSIFPLSYKKFSVYKGNGDLG